MRSSWTMSNSGLNPLRTIAGLALAGSLGALGGCLVTNQGHCGLNQGACDEGLECSVCAVENNGCVPAGSVAEACVFVTGGPNTSTGEPSTQGPDPTTETTPTTDTTSPTTVGPTTIDPTSTTDPTDSTDTTVTTDSTTQVTECQGGIIDPVGCGGVAPYCVDNSCVSCKSIDCAESFPDKPACEVNSGVCVQCVADSDCDAPNAPACNLETATCEGCTAHEQCLETACNLETGECFPEDNVFYVDKTPGLPIECADKDGFGVTPEDPFCRLSEALSRVKEGVPTTIKVKSVAQQQDQATGLPPGDFVVAITQYGGTPVSVVTLTSDAILTFQPGNQVFLNLLNLRNGFAPASDTAVRCDGARVWMDRLRITNTKTAIQATDCVVHVRRSLLHDTSVGGIDMASSAEALLETKLWLENTYITEVGSLFGAVRLALAADADILYSTIALNQGTQVGCFNLMGDVVIRNSAIIGEEPVSPLCMAMESNNYFGTQTDQGMLSNVFSGFAGGVYQAKFEAELWNKAIWESGDPRLDWDGNERPTRSGTQDYAGADHRD